MSATVSAEWLELREPADAAARSEELAGRLAEHLGPGPHVIHDLGGGSGSMGRWLAPRLPGPQRWVVHDRDERLLELAADAFETRRSDITRLAPGDLAGASLVTASALLDLLTREELDADAGRLRRAPAAARADRRRSRRACRRRSRWTRASARRSTTTSAAAAGSAPTPSPPPSTRWGRPR